MTLGATGNGSANAYNDVLPHKARAVDVVPFCRSEGSAGLRFGIAHSVFAFAQNEMRNTQQESCNVERASTPTVCTSP